MICKLKRYSVYFIILSLLTIFCLIWHFLDALSFRSWDFRSNLWGPAYLLIHQYSPYRIEFLFPKQGALWLPMAIGVFFPIGWLSEADATRLWLILNIVEIVAIVIFSLEWRKIQPLLLGSMLALVFLFPPTIAHLWLGQFSVTAIFSMWLALWLLKTQHENSASFFLALAFSKPQLTILFALGLIIYYASNWGLKRACIFGIKVLAWAAVMTIPLFIGYPGWLADLLVNFRSNPNWATPSLYNQMQTAWGNIGLMAWGVLAIIILAINFILWKRLETTEAAVWCFALTPLVSTYIWSWDFVILLPLLAFSARVLQFQTKIVFTSGIYFLLASYVQDQHQQQYWKSAVLVGSYKFHLTYSHHPDSIRKYP